VQPEPKFDFHRQEVSDRASLAGSQFTGARTLAQNDTKRKQAIWVDGPTMFDTLCVIKQQFFFYFTSMPVKHSPEIQWFAR